MAEGRNHFILQYFNSGLMYEKYVFVFRSNLIADPTILTTKVVPKTA
jgi:hypothetical protein